MLIDLLTHLIPTGPSRRARRLAERGEETVGVVDGIRVRRRAEGADIWEYAFAVGPLRIGVRQHLTPQRERAHLGAEVMLRCHDSEAIVDWPGTLARAGSAAASTGASLHGWKPLSDPPRPGLDDDGYRPPQGPSTSVVLHAARRTSAGTRLLSGWEIRLLSDGQPLVLARERVPAWAVHLLVAGTELPARTGRDMVAIDWKQAAEDSSPGTERFDYDAHLPGAEAAADESDLDVDEFMAEFDAWKRPSAG